MPRKKSPPEKVSKTKAPPARKVETLFTKHREGDVATGLAHLTTELANGQARGIVLAIVPPDDGEMDIRVFGRITKMEAVWVSHQILKFVE